MPAPNPALVLRKRLEQRVRTFMLDRDLWPEEGPLLLAVSGGPDSTALLLILARLAKHRRVPLHAAYLDHALRGNEERLREAAFIRELCESMNIPFSAGLGDVSGRARRERTSIEDAARRERYDFLAPAAREIGAHGVATGHTASDQAETVLLHIIRGSGLDGLAGIKPAASWPVAGGDGLTLVRPLLRLTRLETSGYCEAAGVVPVEDESNALPDFTRNRVRNELLPLLRTFNPRIEDALVRLAEAAQGHQGREAIRDVLRNVAGTAEGFGEAHIEAVDRLLRAGTTGDRVMLSRDLQARRTQEAIVVEPSRPPAALPEVEVCLPMGTELRFGHLMLRAASEEPDSAAHGVEVDADAATGLRVRHRRNGDRLQPAGMEGTKKLQDLFVDAHVDRIERDRIPIFENDRGIVWVGGLRIAEWAKPRSSRPTVWLSYRDA